MFNYLNKITLALAGLVFLGVVFYGSSLNERVNTFYQNEISERESLSMALLAPNETDFTVGAPDPKIRIIIYSDTDCPFCKKMEPRFDELMTNYPDEVAVTYRHFTLPIYPGSRYEHIALECVGMLRGAVAYRDFQNNFLFNTQFPEGADYTDDALTLAKIFLGGKADQELEECAYGEEVEDRIKRKVATGNTLGARQTPTMFWVNEVGEYKMQAGSLAYDLMLAELNRFLGAGNELGG